MLSGGYLPEKYLILTEVRKCFVNASGSSVYEEPVLKVNMTIKEEPGVKYMIIGAGGTGGTLGFYLTKAGKDVTLIARGSHLEAMQKQGLTMKQLWDGNEETIPVKACQMEE